MLNKIYQNKEMASKINIIIITSLILYFVMAPPRKACGEASPSAKLPIIYSSHYNITLYGIEKLHPFDSVKYRHVFDYLLNHHILTNDNYYKPDMISNDDLLLVHTKKYLKSLRSSSELAKVSELSILAFIPNFILQKRLINPMKYAAGGTLLGCRLAIKGGWAINLSGGYHHAKADSGGGFCIFADIPIAVYKLRLEHPSLKAMIVDLDAHQGNGYASIFKNDPNIIIFDVYNKQIYPNDSEAKKFIDYKYPIKAETGDTEYMDILKNNLDKTLKEAKPDIVIYNAGTDVYEKDPLGHLKLTEKGIIDRDEYVFKCAFDNNIPILLVLSGGYTKYSALIIGKSISNILKNMIPKYKTNMRGK